MDNNFDEGDNSGESDFATQMSVGLLKEFVYGNTICKKSKITNFPPTFPFL